VSKESRRAARLARESRQAGAASRRPASDIEAGDAGDDVPAMGVTPTRRPVSGASVRAGRRDRVRPGPAPTFLQRYRTAIVSVAAVAIVAVALGYVFIGSTSASYTCTNQFNPSPTPAVSPGSSTRLGFLQDDMGASHVVSTPQKYLFCPPASGNHYNLPGTLGPIPPKLFKPDDKIGPSNWLHNLEHGGMVVLYRNDGPGSTAAGQQAFRDYFAGFPESPICKVPPGSLSPVIARFDDMPHAFAALVWDRVFYLDTWDPALVTQFYLTEAERLDSTGALVAPPEKQCAGPSPSAGSSAPAASGSPAASTPASIAPSAAPSASPEPSAAPS
jgi:hypothetical protein